MRYKFQITEYDYETQTTQSLLVDYLMKIEQPSLPIAPHPNVFV